MTYLETVHRFILPAALSLLPPDLQTADAAQFILAIGWQESKYRKRRQYPHGPARGFWQFEISAVEQVLSHPASREMAHAAIADIGYPKVLIYDTWNIHKLLEHNDVLAAIFARLLLRPLPVKLPTTREEGWNQYLAVWNPGKPREAEWANSWTVGTTGLPLIQA